MEGLRLLTAEVPTQIVPCHRCQATGCPWDRIGGKAICPDCQEQLILGEGAPLVERVRKGGVREVILATSPTLEGDGTALFASNVLAPTGVPVTRLARGLPSGSSLELANSQMLADALDGRRVF